MVTLFQNLRRLFRRRDFERSMAEEIRSHLEMQERPTAPRAWRRRRRTTPRGRQFGHVDGIKEHVRDQRSWGWLEQSLKDFASPDACSRALPVSPLPPCCCSPWASAATRSSSVSSTALLKPLPFPEPAGSSDLDETAPQWNLRYAGINYDDFTAWRAQNQTFAGMAHWRSGDCNVATERRSERLPGQQVTHDLADVFGFQPVLGRMFRADEELGGGAKVALIGHHLWQEWFGLDPAVIGRLF